MFYARGIVGHYLTDDDVRLEWAARTASAHLVEALCTWLDLGDPARDDEAAELMVAGLRALTTAWASEAPPPVERVTAVATASTIRSICSSVVTSGGQNVIVSAGWPLVTTPSPSSRSRTAGDC